MPLTTYTSVCLGKSLLARDVYEFRLSKPDGFTFTPGQFILFNVPLLENPQDIQTRAFSIASAPHEDDLLFVAKMIPGGRASRWIEEIVDQRIEVTFTGPFGRFVLDTSPPPRDLLFIATSTGIAPFRSMIVSALAASDRRRMDIVFGVKSEQDLFWHPAFEELCRSHENVFLHVVLSEPSSAWTGHAGRVQAIAPQVVGNDFSQRSLYVCGSPAMTADVKQLALGAWGMDRKDVHIEGYI